MKNNFSARWLLMTVLMLLYFNSCTKIPDPNTENGDRVLIILDAPAQVTSNSFSLSVSITSRLNLSNAERGVCWSTNGTPTIAGQKITNGSGQGSFMATPTSLSPNTLYFVRGYITSAAGTYYSEERSIRTLASLSSLITNPASSITQTTATTGGQINFDGGAAITERGVCWSTSASPTISNSKITSGIGVGSFSCTLTNLTVNKLYYIRAYAINSVGVAYGNEVSFTTLANLPSIITNPITSITQSSATTGGNVTADGGVSVTERGVCYNTSGSPTTANTKVVSGAGLGTFTSSIAGLPPVSTYYVRAYAINSAGTAYGNQQVFTTIGSLASLLTNTVTSISQTSATGGGNITGSGGYAITERGICWSTTANPTTSASRLVLGVGVGAFSGAMTGLLANTVYYVRAYAINALGTAYGNQVSFITAANIPTVSTSSITSISVNSAVSGGSISTDGGATVTQRGVCYSTSSSPTLANSVVLSGTGIGTFTSNLTGLSSSTTYFVRAFATNSVGTAYGNQNSFTTACILETPTLTSPANGATGLRCCSINFSWSSACGATGYQIQVSRSSAFTGTVFALGVCGGSSFPTTSGVNQATTTVANFCMNGGSSSNNGLWFWRVRSTDGTNFSSWSATRSYTYTW